MIMVVLGGNKNILVELYIKERIIILGIGIDDWDSINGAMNVRKEGRQLLKGSMLKRLYQSYEIKEQITVVMDNIESNDNFS